MEQKEKGRQCIHIVWSERISFPSSNDRAKQFPASFWYKDKAFVDVYPVDVWQPWPSDRKWGGFPIDTGGTDVKNGAGKVAAAATLVEKNAGLNGSGWVTSGLTTGAVERTTGGQRQLKIRWPTGRPTHPHEEKEFAKHVPATFVFEGQTYANAYPVETGTEGKVLFGWFNIANTAPAPPPPAPLGPARWQAAPWDIKHRAYNVLRFRFEIEDRSKLSTTANPNDRTQQGHGRLIPHHYEVLNVSLSPNVLVVDGLPTEVVDWLFRLGNRWNIVGEWDVVIPPPPTSAWVVDGYWAKHGPNQPYPTYIDLVYQFSPMRTAFWQSSGLHSIGYSDAMIQEQVLDVETRLVPRDAAASSWDGTLDALRADQNAYVQKPYICIADETWPWYAAVFRVYASARPAEAVKYKAGYDYTSQSVLDGERNPLRPEIGERVAPTGSSQARSHTR